MKPNKIAGHFFLLINQYPWLLRLVLVVLGVISSLAFAPYHLVFLLVPAFSFLIWFLDIQTNRISVFAPIWWFGLGHFVFGNAWMANAILVRADEFWWLYPIALFVPGAVLATLPALLGAVVWSKRKSPDITVSVISVAFAWSLSEWLRCWMLTGYPWNLIGYVWSNYIPVLQSVNIIGVLGLGLLTLITAMLPVLFWSPTKKTVINLKNITFLAGMVFIWLGIVIYGVQRLHYFPTTYVPGILLRLVQPAISQQDKINPDNYQRNLNDYLRLTRNTSNFHQVTHVIWPESSVSYDVERYPEVRQLLSSAVPEGGKLIFGANRLLWQGDQVIQAWNSLYVINQVGDILARYDKTHLVPFGEYVPGRSWFPWLNKITPGALDFSAGSGHVTLTLENDILPPFSPLICYEVIFPGQVKSYTDRPTWLLNITNDGWFGLSSGPYQHFEMAKTRAVEEGIPLIRVAATGISGVVDPYGRVLALMPLNQVGVVDAPLPKPHPTRTWYSKFGNSTFLVLLGMLAIFLVWSRVTIRRKPAGQS